MKLFAILNIGVQSYRKEHATCIFRISLKQTYKPQIAHQLLKMPSKDLDLLKMFRIYYFTLPNWSPDFHNEASRFVYH